MILSETRTTRLGGSINAAALFATHLNVPSSSVLMVWSRNYQRVFIIVGKCNGDVSLLCDEIVAISASGQIRSFDFPQIDGQNGEMHKPLPLFEQFIQANICCSYIGDIDGDGLSELLVLMTDRCVRTYRYVANHLASLNKYEVPSHVYGFALGATASGQYYVLLAERNENYVVKIDFGSNSCNILPQTLASNPFSRELAVPNQPIYLGLVGSLAARLLVLNPESGAEVTLENPAGDFICATTVNLQNNMHIVMTLDIYGNLLVYGWTDVTTCQTCPIAKTTVLPDADRISALSINENEILFCLCTVYFKIAVYRIDLSSVLN
uniref:Cleavage/polyadenylation specificity factor A subunit N-terminal domain-containing protein n=1 Tax=Setaria digitata TaxID=48799 RepID=A0A915PLY1_9BILA